MSGKGEKKARKEGGEAERQAEFDKQKDDWRQRGMTEHERDDVRARGCELGCCIRAL